MKCPHCLVEFHDAWNEHDSGKDADGYWRLRWTTCPSCKKFTMQLNKFNTVPSGGLRLTASRMVHPKGTSRSPLSADVPAQYAADYGEACVVLPDSSKASAALSRRCLQRLIREHVGITRKDLAHEIDELLASKSLPSQLSDAVDGVRNVGNFAAHPLKSTNTGEVVDVEPGEAEWLLDTLEGLFDFYFVQPAVLRKKKDALNKKLADLGKPPMK